MSSAGSSDPAGIDRDIATRTWPSARDDYPKLHANTSGTHHRGQTSQEAQALLDEVDRLRDDVYNLARLATQCSDRDVQLYVNRIAHRNRSTGFGERIRSLITWRVIGTR